MTPRQTPADDGEETTSPRLAQVLLTPGVLEEARLFFEDRGSIGCEGTALIAGVPGRPADRLVVPDQLANPSPRAWVRITDAGELDLLTALRDDQRMVARIHSHPGEAFHSETDDANPVLTHQGALSIVVPWFGLGLRHGLDACAVYQLRRSNWHLLPPGRHRDRRVQVS
jgi:hypothetical protein